MSRITSVVSVTYTLTAPPVPATTIDAFAFVRPSGEFIVEVAGCPWPAGQMVKYPSGPCGTTVTFREKAVEVLGILHPPRSGSTKFRDSPRWSGSFVLRVSDRRQG